MSCACPHARLWTCRHRLAFAILHSQCPPGRPNVYSVRTPSPKPDPFAPPYPKKASLSRPTRSRPCPIQPHPCPTSSPRLRYFSPPIRPNPAISPPLLNHTHIRATLAHARDRPRGPETLTPNGVRPQASVGASKTSHRPPTRPLSCSVTPCHLCVPSARCLHDRLVQDSRHSQLRNAQNVAETNRFRLPAKLVAMEACPELAEWAGSGNNVVGGAR